MSRDDIIRMAREAWDRDEDLWLTHEQYFLERFAALVAAAEREACAKVCEYLDVTGLSDHHGWLRYTVNLCMGLATTIRARGTE